MAGQGLARLGGLCGLLYALLMVPAYVVGYPDAPTPGSSAEDVVEYFGASPGTFVLANGTLAVFSTFFFLWFLAALYGVLRRAEGAAGLSPAVLTGGTLFIVLSCAGYAAEVIPPATALRFENFASDADPAFTSLAFSAWLYHFGQAGAAVMILATSLICLGTGALPRWLALGGLVVALLTLLHFTLPLIGALAGLLWVAVVSAIMLISSQAAPARRRTTRS